MLPMSAARCATFGSTGAPADASVEGPASFRVSATAAPTTSTVRATRAEKPLGCMTSLSSRCCVAPRATAQAHQSQHDRDERDEDGDGRDVDELQAPLEAVDVLPHPELHLAQLLTRLQHLGAESLDRLRLLGREIDAALPVLDEADVLHLALDVLELV